MHPNFTDTENICKYVHLGAKKAAKNMQNITVTNANKQDVIKRNSCLVAFEG